MFHDSDSDNLLKLLLTRTEILSRRVNDFVVVVVLEVVVALILVDGKKGKMLMITIHALPRIRN